MRFFAILTLLGLALVPAFTQTVKPPVKKTASAKTTSTAKPKPKPKPKPTPGKAATAKTTAKTGAKITAKTPVAAKPKPGAAKPLTPTGMSAPKPKTPAGHSIAKTPAARPKSAAPPPPKPDEKTEWEKASSTVDTKARIAALQKFNETFPKSDRHSGSLELISATRGQMGNEKLVAGDLSAATALFKLAAAEAPKPMSDQLFGEALSKIPTNLFFRGAREGAFEIAKILEEKSDTNVGQLLTVASFYMSVEDGAGARGVADTALKLNPESSPAWQTMGLADRMDFMLDESAGAYAHALAIEPDSLPARRGLAEMKRSLGRADEAVTLYREILAKDATNLPAETGLILALFDAEKRSEAEAEMRKSTTANPGNVILLAGAAYWYAAHNEGDKAVEFAQKAIAAEPRFIWSYIAEARGYMAQKKPTEAEKVLLVARQYGQFPTLGYELASARIAAGFYREAAEELVKNFTVKDGVVSAKLGGRVLRESKSFTELVGPERRASIFAPTAADDPENANRLVALLELKQQLAAAEPKADAISAAADAFIRGDDKMKVHRQIFAASQILEKKVALPKVVEIAKAAVANVDTGLDAPSATSAILASELYESRSIAVARGDYVTIPDVSRFTLSSIIRGRIEELNGWAFYEMDNPTESVLRLRRSVSVLPADSAWWRSSMWRLGSALVLSGKDAEGLDAYIKCYKASGADTVRYSVIESLYKRLNGNTDGLEAKIGAKPAPSAPVAQKFEPKPAPDVKPETPPETKVETVPSAPPEIKFSTPKPNTFPLNPIAKKLEPTPTPEVKIEVPAPPKPEPTVAATPDVKMDTVPAEVVAKTIEPTPTPEVKVEIQTPPKPEPTVAATPEIKADAPKTRPIPAEAVGQKIETAPTPTPEAKPDSPAATKTQPLTTATPETKIEPSKAEPSPSPTPDVKIDASKQVAELIPDTPKTNVEKPKETPTETKPANAIKDLFPPIVISIPPPDTSKTAAKERVVKSDPTPVQSETKPAEDPNAPKPENKINPPPTATGSRPRIIDSKPIAEIKPCVLNASDEILTLNKSGNEMAVVIGLDDDGELDGLTATSNSPKNVSVTRKVIEGVTTRGIFIIRSITPNTGMYQIKFDMPCGKKVVLIKVK